MHIKERINNIKKSKDGRTLVANFGYLSLLQVAGYIFPLITIPYLARVIGVESFGKIAFASAVVVWFQTIADWGFNFTATRDVAKNRDNKESVSEIFSNVLWARILLMVFSFLLILIAIALIPKFRENSTVILITFLMVPGSIMFPDWFFQAMERMRYITLLNLISKTLFTIAIFVFVKQKSDFILQPLFTSLGYVVSGSISMYFILVRWQIKLKSPKIKPILQTINRSTDVFINNLMPNLYYSFSILLLGMYGGQIANGKLDAGNKFINVSQQLMNTLSRTFYPFLSRRIDKHDLYAKLNIYLSLSISILLFLFAPVVIKLLFTPEFNDAIIVMRILSISVFLITTRGVYGTNYMIIQGYEKQLRNLTFIGSLVGFILSFPLIYYFNLIGAAINIVLTQAILGICITTRALKIKRISN